MRARPHSPDNLWQIDNPMHTSLPHRGDGCPIEQDLMTWAMHPGCPNPILRERETLHPLPGT